MIYQSYKFDIFCLNETLNEITNGVDETIFACKNNFQF